ncbi:Ger(x)C family spore germination protein [Paenibacillus sp. FSL W7-1287]|uniref:Ger(x)C family spore germination protein n=1 Tax=Paenibacillus sp. FSL W7-1287 TaxID=2954538 RepID=UPI0030FD1A74
MSKCLFKLVSALMICTLLLSGCWSSREIEEQSVYVGMALDIANKSERDKHLEAQGGITAVDSLITATLQIVPIKSVKGNQSKEEGGVKKYLNDSETGDSIFEILRKYALKRDRAVIGHHLKVFVISTELLEKIDISTLLDFMLRDNDIRPSCMVFLARSKAADVLETNQPDEIPAFYIRNMTLNKYRNNEIMNGVILTNLDQYIESRQSFVLQNIATYKGESEFAGAGIIKGATGKWIGNLTQEDVSSLSWVRGEGNGGLLKAVDDNNKIIIYEIKSLKTKVIPKVDGDRMTFQVNINSEGRLIENWDNRVDVSKIDAQMRMEEIFEERLNTMIQNLMNKLQKEYKAEVAGFGERLKITHPKVWQKVKKDWDEVFSDADVNVNIKLKITDYGSSAE